MFALETLEMKHRINRQRGKASFIAPRRCFSARALKCSLIKLIHIARGNEPMIQYIGNLSISVSRCIVQWKCAARTLHRGWRPVKMKLSG